MPTELHWITKSPLGRVAISARPRGGDWLDDEIQGWRKQGVDIVVSLLTQDENHDLDLEDEGSAAERNGIKFYSFPIEDRGLPTSSANVDRLLNRLSSQIDDGKNVVIHCRQGIGRSSLLAAALLVVKGEDLEESLKTMSSARGLEVPETSAQRNWLERFARGRHQELIRHDH